MNPESPQTLVSRIQESQELYVVISAATSLPYVHCDEETYDDEIFMFFQKEEAEALQRELEEVKERTRVNVLETTQRLPFFTGLATMGVNAVYFGKCTKEEQRIYLNEIIKMPDIPRMNAEIRKELSGNPEMQIRVENPEFHLTAMYYLQKVRGEQGWQESEETKELYEEMMVHYREGFFIAARKADGGIPLLKMQNNEMFQPIFTDVLEYFKFKQLNPGAEFKTGILTESEILANMPKEASGLLVNPVGICLTLAVQKNS